MITFPVGSFSQYCADLFHEDLRCTRVPRMPEGHQVKAARADWMIDSDVDVYNHLTFARAVRYTFREMGWTS